MIFYYRIIFYIWRIWALGKLSSFPRHRYEYHLGNQQIVEKHSVVSHGPKQTSGKKERKKQTNHSNMEMGTD
ncbi:hypothetical protein C5167_020650 [Papaver somniferum]|uniref:Uncharacterized protein n=1 Tax=Papaver somniferum TaxID=3469 RepID=A0A4Y7ITK8_PAPSO|nr:hypothetical protein C5167_020650 [Papaver somniferum]